MGGSRKEPDHASAAPNAYDLEAAPAPNAGKKKKMVHMISAHQYDTGRRRKGTFEYSHKTEGSHEIFHKTRAFRISLPRWGPIQPRF